MTYVVLAKTERRLVEIERLQEDRYHQQFRELLDHLSDDQVLALTILAYLTKDNPGPPMAWPPLLRWLRGGMEPALLPAPMRPDLERAQDMARRFTASIEAGEHVDDDPELVDWCCWLVAEQDNASRSDLV